MKTKLTLSALKDLDMGKVDVAFDEHVARALRDIEERPGDQKARRVLLDISFTPAEPDGNTVHAEFSMKSSVPVHRTRKYEMAVRRVGQKSVAVFNPESPVDIHQGTLDDTRHPEGVVDHIGPVGDKPHSA